MDVCIVRGIEVELGRDGRFGIVGVFFQQCFDTSAADGYDIYLYAAGGGLLDITVRVADRIEEGIDLFILQQTGSLHGLDLFRIDGIQADPEGGQNILGILQLPGTRVADIDPFAFQVLDVFNTTICCGNQGY
jgi:hypothetical protein